MARIIAIGASQGGVHALRGLLAPLEAGFPASILVVMHTGEQSLLPSLLSEVSKLSASHAHSGEQIRPGHIHVAPPDHHMLVVDGRLELTRGPRENWARPAIDPTFRTAAEAYGPDVVGVILTGMLNDGTSGLFEIKRRGGLAIVQDPSEAEAPSMPRSALQNVQVDYCVRLLGIPALLVRLAERRAKQPTTPGIGGVAAMSGDQKILTPSAQTCPECGGAMREEQQGSITKFRCHIGHVMTAEVLEAAQIEMLERKLSSALRTLNERTALCNALAQKCRAGGNTVAAAQWERAAEQTAKREDTMRKLAQAEWIRPEATAENC